MNGKSYPTPQEMLIVDIAAIESFLGSTRPNADPTRDEFIVVEGGIGFRGTAQQHRERLVKTGLIVADAERELLTDRVREGRGTYLRELRMKGLV